MIRIILKCVYLCFVFGFFTTTHAAVTPDAPTNFITTWNTENSGTSANNQITIPGTGAGYNYEIYWENTASSTQNGTTTLITTSSYTLTFPEPGIYEVQASGTFPRIFFNNTGDKDKILTVEQWGDIAWTSMAQSFFGCTNLTVPATDAPDLSGVTDMSSMFQSAASFNQPIEHWNVSNVTNMYSLFLSASIFNQPLNNWDVSNVTNMAWMFERTWDFNQPLNNWDVSNVTVMNRMFYGGAEMSPWNNPPNKFNQDISMWDTSSVTGMHLMFRNSDFNQPLNNWDVSKVQNFSEMFFASDFNQPLNNWDTSSSTNMLWMFRDNVVFDQDLSTWDISGNTNMSEMFLDAALSTQNLDATLTSWAAQPVQPNILFHLGLKTYTETGATALATLRDTYNWTITEQYKAEYYPSADAILEGTSIQSPLDYGATTTAVTITPKKNCTFIQWSDGNTDNPRQDVLTDNLSVTAELHCVTYSTSAATQRDRARQYGNETHAEVMEDRFLSDETTTSTLAAYTPPATLAESLEQVKALPKTLNTIDIATTDKGVVKDLIQTLLALVEVLTKLLLSMESEG
ncbi:MAG: DUF285 domain-containing protein [Candidatus Nomurabacteria bacterium]|nr:MAG: DUF285 domain-containing protein [Candidatus Nomurabacteria bacterium]